jgi:hypothetical protein
MKFKKAATAGLSLTLNPMGKMLQKFCRGPCNDHSWAVWFQLSKWFQRRSVLKHFSKFYVFCSDMKFKMAATAGHSLTLDPMGKMFQNTSSLKPLGQLHLNIFPYG